MEADRRSGERVRHADLGSELTKSCPPFRVLFPLGLAGYTLFTQSDYSRNRFGIHALPAYRRGSTVWHIRVRMEVVAAGGTSKGENRRYMAVEGSACERGRIQTKGEN